MISREGAKVAKIYYPFKQRNTPLELPRRGHFFAAFVREKA
jgi:hypothetical protein